MLIFSPIFPKRLKNVHMFSFMCFKDLHKGYRVILDLLQTLYRMTFFEIYSTWLHTGLVHLF